MIKSVASYKPYTLTVAGNYLPEATVGIKSALIRAILTAKRNADRNNMVLTLLLPETPSGLASLCDRLCRSLSVASEIKSAPPEDYDLVILVRLDIVKPDKYESLADSLSQQFEAAESLFSGNDRKATVSVVFDPSHISVKPPERIDLTQMITPEVPCYNEYNTRKAELLNRETQAVESPYNAATPPHGKEVPVNVRLAAPLNQT